MSVHLRQATARSLSVYNTMVSMLTIRFNIRTICILQHGVFMCFVLFRLSAVISSVPTNKLAFVAKTVWPVRQEFKFKIYIIKNSSSTRYQSLIPHACLFYVGFRNCFISLVLGKISLLNSYL
jgi:hypothetical protein